MVPRVLNYRLSRFLYGIKRTSDWRSVLCFRHVFRVRVSFSRIRVNFMLFNGVASIATAPLVTQSQTAVARNIWVGIPLLALSLVQCVPEVI